MLQAQDFKVETKIMSTYYAYYVTLQRISCIKSHDMYWDKKNGKNSILFTKIDTFLHYTPVNRIINTLNSSFRAHVIIDMYLSYISLLM